MWYEWTCLSCCCWLLAAVTSMNDRPMMFDFVLVVNSTICFFSPMQLLASSRASGAVCAHGQRDGVRVPRFATCRSSAVLPRGASLT